MKIELLAPAKDKICAFAAIDYGADAIYIGAPKFGARKKASNSIDDINEAIQYAHKFNVKVYPVINTILYDNELKEAEDLINSLYTIGADAIIIQDTGILEMNLPPIQIFASTQMHNYSLDRIKFLESIGIKRVILARELSLNQINYLRANTSLEFEFFIHGALCVSFSGQCYFSEAITNKSANRGECTQPCRMKYDLLDSNGKILLKNKNLLSLKDLNLSEYLNQLIDSGITSFKIEGRLKDSTYVKNITAYYRNLFDNIIKNRSNLQKSSSGYTKFNFVPDPYKSFNRSFTSYYINNNKQNHVASLNTEKSLGELLGPIKSIGDNYIIINTQKKINNGDGICFFVNDKLFGTNVNNVIGNKVYLNAKYDLKPDTLIYRNNDIEFEKFLNKNKIKRKIKIKFIVKYENSHLFLTAIDEDDYQFTSSIYINNKISNNVRDKIITQLKKTGDTIFEVNEVTFLSDIKLDIPFSLINSLRREVTSSLEQIRLNRYKRIESRIIPSDTPYPEKILDYKYNVTNSKAKEFYYRHKVDKIEDGFELLNDKSNKEIMTTKYCLRYEIGLCPLYNNKVKPDILYLLNNNIKYKIVFNCKECQMKIYTT